MPGPLRPRPSSWSTPAQLRPKPTAAQQHTPIRPFSQLQRRQQNATSAEPSPPASPPAPTADKMSTPPELTHLTAQGTAHMVSIAGKTATARSATAVATLAFSNTDGYTALTTASLKKGDALAVARVAGILAAKKTPDLIPLAHPSIGLSGVVVDVDLIPPAGDGAPATAGPVFGAVTITATVTCMAPTGVEMEALTAATTAGLTLYDMCKAVDRGMALQGVRVVEKKGGSHGAWHWDAVRGQPVQGVQAVMNFKKDWEYRGGWSGGGKWKRDAAVTPPPEDPHADDVENVEAGEGRVGEGAQGRKLLRRNSEWRGEYSGAGRWKGKGDESGASTPRKRREGEEVGEHEKQGWD